MIVLLKVLVNNTVKCIGSPKTRKLLFCAFKTNLCDVNEKKICETNMNLSNKHILVNETFLIILITKYLNFSVNMHVHVIDLRLPHMHYFA